MSHWAPAKNPEFRPWTWRQLYFKNPLGIAGGLDKSGDQLLSWQKLGAGFLEVGTVTPKAQGPNPGLILQRDLATTSIWNKMGFPNHGVDHLKEKIKKLRPYLQIPLFINIGKNRNTDNAHAADDYKLGLQELSDLADGFVINISSPNTKNLRELLQPENLKNFLQPVLGSCGRAPILLKLSPDMDTNTLLTVLSVSMDVGIDGWILTNTTLSRERTPQFPTEGGVSGSPLAKTSLQFLETSANWLAQNRNDHLLVSVGGILSTQDIQRRLSAGAHLLQFYTALVFEGPFFFQKSLKQLQQKKM